jgi:hypothetical protein
MLIVSESVIRERAILNGAANRIAALAKADTRLHREWLSPFRLVYTAGMAPNNMHRSQLGQSKSP